MIVDAGTSQHKVTGVLDVVHAFRRGGARTPLHAGTGIEIVARP